jgi:hypothetical protein
LLNYNESLTNYLLLYHIENIFITKYFRFLLELKHNLSIIVLVLKTQNKTYLQHLKNTNYG